MVYSGKDYMSEEFVNNFTYNGQDLGSVYTQEQTILKVWAPTALNVQCHLLNNQEEQLLDMVAEEQGVWSLRLQGDYEGCSYIYHVFFEDRQTVATDPYALASTPNHERSVIVDWSKTIIDNNKHKCDDLLSYTDAIIYELHVRDFSMDEHSGISNRGKYLGLIEEGVTTSNGKESGLDYLTSLGVTHIQLLPVYDYGSVDEKNPLASYNWGYDPVQYNVPEGSYSSDVSDPYSRIIELKKVIAHMHSKGLRVIMDVVYNHMYDMAKSAFQNIVPGYYFRIGEDGTISNGSFCGNDIDSTKPMVRNYLLQSTRLWIEDYGFDGFRFDLMGILDIDTMNAIASQTQAIDKNTMIYGEGWNMPTLLDDARKATMMNHKKMPSIAHFSDIFREKIKGGTLEDKFDEGGYGSGDITKFIDTMSLLQASVIPVDYKSHRIESYFLEPTFTVNYVECHDNHTLWDKLTLALPKESKVLRTRRQMFINSIVLLSQGIPFIHAGQEFLRTKHGEHNSYQSSDAINMFRWLEKDKEQQSVDYMKDLIWLRQEYDEFRLPSKELIKEYIHVYTLDQGVIVYNLRAIDPSCGYSSITVYFNPNLEAYQLFLDEAKEVVFDHHGKLKNKTKKQEVTIEPLAIICLRCD